jgi:glycine/serine hydroxymethyltransferase
MSKLLIEVNLFQKLIDTFFKAKVDGNEEKFKTALKKQSPELGDAFEEYDNQLLKNAERLKQALKGTGVDTSKMDYWADQLKKLS